MPADQAVGQLASAHNDSLLRAARRIAHVGNWTLDFASGRLTWSEQVYRNFELDPLPCSGRSWPGSTANAYHALSARSLSRCAANSARRSGRLYR